MDLTSTMPGWLASAGMAVDIDRPSSAVVMLAVMAAAAVIAAVAVGWLLPGVTGAMASLSVTVLMALFCCLAAAAHRAGAGTALDHSVLDWMIHQRGAWLTPVAVAVMGTGSPVAVTAAVIAAVLWLRSRSPRQAIALAATLALAATASTVTKRSVDAQRPPLADRAVQLVHQSDASFPSGHVTATLALIGITAVILCRGRGRAAQIAVAAAATVTGAAVGATPAYLGVHWLTDVAGAVLLAGSAVLLGAALLGRLTSAPSATNASFVTTSPEATHHAREAAGRPMMDSADLGRNGREDDAVFVWRTRR
ncbi:MAG: rane-associated phospholipid phosphatase [Mycobacterium sp.]|jgi:membrane-associated phospholipid phosphatase|nr:rane-associated phospholipid phosphatase [Mycobacterium sp.]